jgi:septal ring factor EnvC (AmiA/AmiB activator)
MAEGKVTVWQGDEINLFQLLEDRRIESEKRADVLHKRIGELRDEMTQKIDQSHNEIMQEIRALRQEQREHAKEMSERVSKLERWKWGIVGGAATVGFILAGGIEALHKFM